MSFSSTLFFLGILYFLGLLAMKYNSFVKKKEEEKVRLVVKKVLEELKWKKKK